MDEGKLTCEGHYCTLALCTRINFLEQGTVVMLSRQPTICVGDYCYGIRTTNEEVGHCCSGFRTMLGHK